MAGSGKNLKFRTLEHEPSNSKSAHTDSQHSPSTKSKRALTKVACVACQRGKVKCDGAVPSCSRCATKGAVCNYDAEPNVARPRSLRRRHDALQDEVNELRGFIGLVHERPDNEAMELFRRIRITNDPSEVVKSFLATRNDTSTPDVNVPASSADKSNNSLSALPIRSIRKDVEAQVDQGSPASTQQPPRSVTVPHRILTWPYIYEGLINSRIATASDLQSILQEGTAWFVKGDLWKHPNPLPPNIGLLSTVLDVNAAEHGRTHATFFPALTGQEIQTYSDAYFNTFNTLYPLLDEETFMNEVIAVLLQDGFQDGDFGGVLALLVFALGQVAVEGVYDWPIGFVGDRPSGFRGGSFDHPPGLPFFNEARRRLGFVSTHCSLENVQIMLLQATYYQSAARHLDFWRSTIAASSACQVLIRHRSIDWSSANGDLVKRAYWSCVLTEELFHLDLDLPQTGISTLEDEVPLPHFHILHNHRERPTSPLSDDATMAGRRDYQGNNFLAMISLRRVIAAIHHEIFEDGHTADRVEPLFGRSSAPEADDPFDLSTSQAGLSKPYGGPPMALVHELERQLDSWRALLPPPLQWSDTGTVDSCASNLGDLELKEPLLSAGKDPSSNNYKYNMDIITAQLRSRFYYGRFLVYRPFVYKALHFPDQMTAEDCHYCALAIKSVCVWPLALAPPKNKKRLVPHTWAWPQQFMGILLLLDSCSTSHCLRRIIESGAIEPQVVDQTIRLMMEWVEDTRQLDGIAERSWSLAKSIYEKRSS